jgi:hypothetical protein
MSRSGCRGGRHLILKAVIKDLSKVAGAPYEVGSDPI